MSSSDAVKERARQARADGRGPNREHDTGRRDGSGGAATLNRALVVLETLASSNESGMSVSELAEATALNRVTVHRILAAFRSRDYVRQTRPRGPYRLGFRLLGLAESALTEFELAGLAKPILKSLCEKTGETSHLAVLDGSEAVYIEKVEPTHPVRLVSRVGSRLPLHSTALGKAMLASLPPHDTRSTVARLDLERRSDATATDPAVLLAEIEEVRAHGYAVDRGENEEYVHCVASAVSSPSRTQPVALSVSGPSQRIPESRFEGLGRLVMAAAEELGASTTG